VARVKPFLKLANSSDRNSMEDTWALLVQTFRGPRQDLQKFLVLCGKRSRATEHWLSRTSRAPVSTIQTKNADPQKREIAATVDYKFQKCNSPYQLYPLRRSR
jgi:hypothetical protein